ncbi:glutathione ABC transporter substrate-binding protein [Anaerocolumna sp. MB42-C2]|uniref:glutathione ABC transporter substrate-binding protein n=1 Tax=Anaerocolumna sp. MB42-C2 TaxID=3070997 RepID=UPI0027E0F53A|nr:glutathione ABC transporter substrate-binding protein [Anaerocolumna sp. MB42-C2]WMJ89424.1 glutathione ABC transporter substrate-binding protein [Anaerocolumna sp. MB42-C2]
MKNYKKILALLLTAVMVISLAGCKSKSTSTQGNNDVKTANQGAGTTKEADTAQETGELVTGTTQGVSADNDLVIAVETSISSLDPHNLSDTLSISATRAMYENLVMFDENMKIVGQLAESYEISDDSLTYTFHLRKGVKFHDGTDFNAAAVKANFDRFMNKDNNLRIRGRFILTEGDVETDRIKSIETPDDNTVVFQLSAPYSPFINKLTLVPMISPAAIEKYGNDGLITNPVGTGPYIFKEWVEGDHMTATKNPDYWGTKPGVDSVTMKEVPEAGSRTAMLQTGEADFIYPMPSDQISAVKTTGDITVNATTSTIMRYVTLNTNLKELSDVKVRQAMNYAIDRNAYVQLMYAGYGAPATSVMAPSISYYSEQPAYEYNLDKAKSLLAEAGYPDGFKLTLWGDNSTQEVKGMTFIKQQLEQIGIEVEVVPMEPATVSDKIYVPLEEAKINMWYVNWSPSSCDADGAMRALFYSKMCPPTSANTAYYNNTEVDKLLDQGISSADPSELTKIYAEAQSTIWKDAPWLFLGNDQNIFANKTYLTGVSVAPDGAINFANATLTQ